MKIRFAFLAAAIMAAAPVARADDAAKAASAVQTKALDQPWVKDTALLNATIADVQKAGMKAVAQHTADLERALAGAKQSFEIAAAGGDKTTYALSDSPNRAVQDVMATATDKSRKPVTAAFNPYPGISFFLASYYDLSGKPEDALRVVDAGLALPGVDASSHRTELLVERATALGVLKRWPECLAAYDSALKVEGNLPAIQAYIQRGRGHALTQLGRTVDAKAAYAESARLVRNDPDAQRQLDYIRKSRDTPDKP
jgi:tetratricopeptide (TPR) repeat protein